MGDEGEVAALLDPMIYTWFWISPHPWTATSAVSAEVRASEGVPSWHRVWPR